MRAFVKQFVSLVKIKKWETLQIAGFMLGVYVVGMAVFQVGSRIFSDGGDDVFYLGSVFSVVVLLMLMTFVGAISQTTYFNYSIAMGRVRGIFWPALALECFLLYAFLQVEILLLQYVEGWLLGLTSPAAAPVGLAGILAWEYVVPLALAGAGVTLLCTACLVKFGKNAYIVWYVLFVGVCIGVPRLLHRLDNMGSPVYTRFVNMLASNTILLSVIGGVFVAVVCYAASWLMIRRQPVKI